MHARKNAMVPVTRQRFVEFVANFPKVLERRVWAHATALPAWPRLVEYRDGEQVLASAVLDRAMNGTEYSHDHKIRDDHLG